MVTKAAVLCGGEGTRLRPLTNYFQKTMIPIRKRRPLLEYIVRLILYYGIHDVTLLCGYKADEIETTSGTPQGSALDWTRVHREGSRKFE